MATITTREDLLRPLEVTLPDGRSLLVRRPSVADIKAADQRRQQDGDEMAACTLVARCLVGSDGRPMLATVEEAAELVPADVVAAICEAIGEAPASAVKNSPPTPTAGCG